MLGDADCISTLELSQNRPGFRSSNFTLITETFRNLSYGEFPVEASRVNPPDDRVLVTRNVIFGIRVVLMWIIPLLFVTGCITLLIRRKRK